MKHNVYVDITIQVPGQSGGLGLYTIVPNARKKKKNYKLNTYGIYSDDEVAISWLHQIKVRFEPTC